MRRFLSNVLAVAYKEARVVRHDKAVMSSIAAQPVIMMLLFGWGQYSSGGTPKRTRAPMVVRR